MNLRILMYLICLLLISFWLFIIAGSILHTNIPLTDFILSIIAANMIYQKCESYIDKRKNKDINKDNQ